MRFGAIFIESPMAKTKAPNPSGKRGVISNKQWSKIRIRWETDPSLSLSQLARLFDLSLSAVKYRAKTQAWTKRDLGEPAKVVKLSGRPTEYKPEYCRQIIDYFENYEPYREIQNPENPTLIRLVPNKPKTMTGFAAEIGVNRTTLWTWAHARDHDGHLINPEFHNAFNAAMALSENLLIQGALVGCYNSNITQLLLKNHHFYQPIVPPPAVHDSDRINDAELDAVYEAARLKAQEVHKALKGRYERITGLAPPFNGESVLLEND